MTTIRRASPPGPALQSLLDEARTCLERGDLVGLPTETVYGVAADPTIPEAMDRLYAAKQRPAEKQLAWLVPDQGWEELDGLRDSRIALALGRLYWPGPLTLVVDTADGSRGYRMPDHSLALDLLRHMGRPLAVSSANLSGFSPASTAAEAVDQLGAAVALYLDAGSTGGGVPSTVVKISHDHVQILREGAIPTREITADY